MSKVFQEGGGDKPCPMLQEANKMRAEVVIGKCDNSRFCGIVFRENRRGDGCDSRELLEKRT